MPRIYLRDFHIGWWDKIKKSRFQEESDVLPHRKNIAFLHGGRQKIAQKISLLAKVRVRMPVSYMGQGKGF